VSQRRVLEAVFILLEFPSPSRRIFIGSHSLPPSLVRRFGPSSGPRHWRRADRLRVLDLRQTDDNLQSRLWRHVVVLSFGHRGGLSAGHPHRLGGSSGSSLGLRCQAFNGHRFGNSAPLGFSTYQQEDTGLVTIDGYDYSLRLPALAQCTHPLRCWPPAMQPP
jgi:hypothetical protein